MRNGRRTCRLAICVFCSNSYFTHFADPFKGSVKIPTGFAKGVYFYEVPNHRKGLPGKGVVYLFSSRVPGAKGGPVIGTSVYHQGQANSHSLSKIIFTFM